MKETITPPIDTAFSKAMKGGRKEAATYSLRACFFSFCFALLKRGKRGRRASYIQHAYIILQELFIYFWSLSQLGNKEDEGVKQHRDHEVVKWIRALSR